uniref:Aminopeptidase n=1 Tax=Oncorhynchus tshawytscha TaxID=74940 RepID=A0AAZ3R2H9_ONCTS
MAKGFYISKNMGLAGLLIGAVAVVIIIALAAVYDKEKTKNQNKPVDGVAMLTTASPTTSSTLSTPKDPWEHYRLPDSLSPVSYNITLWPRLVVNASTGLYIFTGQSAVVFQCKKDTDLIVIHCNKLNLTLLNGHHARLTGLDGATAPTVKTSWLQVKTEYLVIQLNGKLTAGKSYRLSTDFQGELADDLKGFYRSEYTEDGGKKVVATSQMQATFARKAFPCFDEPAMKAVFHITLIHQRGTVALSNGRDVETVNSTIDGTEVTMTRFEPTKRMSTYLLAFIVSDFDHITGSIENNNVLVRIWARRKAIAEGHGNYALNVTGPMLKFFQRYYNASYPLSKSDQIALPDFNAGAMENWGLITYRETALLYDPAISSVGNKERVLTVVAHELAHMWFGNLVTLRWWNDLWLNEGFASYVEYLGADYAEPTWNIKEQTILNDVHKVFAVDALASSHPLSRKEEEVNQPDEISEMFNTISYSKVLYVLEHLLQQGFLCSRTSPTVLYVREHLLQQGMSLPHTVHDIMNRWILQMGFPVVTIDTATGHITQKHFLLDPDSVVDRPSPYNYTWLVPIKWMKGGVEREQHWLLQETGISNASVSGSEWVLANLNVSGYYRVNYDMDNWERLLNQLTTDHTVIPLINRAQIVDDAFNLARAKVINTTLALRTTRYLSQERDYIPWESALRNLNYYILMFDRGQAYGVLQGYLKMQITPLFEYFRTITVDWTRKSQLKDSWNQEGISRKTGSPPNGNYGKSIPETLRMFRVNVIVFLLFNDADFVFMQLFIDRIHPNLKTTVYCNAIAAGGVAEWDFAWQMFKNATVATEAAKLRSSLACTKVPWLLNRYLDYSLDPAKIRKQDCTSTINYIAGNVVGMPLAWDFIRARYGGGSFSFSNLINGVTRRFSTEFELKQLKQFKEDNARVGFGSGTLALEQAIERTTANIKWVAENQEHVMKWLANECT